MRRVGSRGGGKGKLIALGVFIVVVVAAMFYFKGKAESSLPEPQETVIEVDGVL